MPKKLSVLVLCGGRSTEHVISIQSARNVVRALDQEKYSVSIVYLTHENASYFIASMDDFLTKTPNDWVAASHLMQNLLDLPNNADVDCFFSLLHGTYGEDGCMQGLLRLLNKPFVGCGVLSSAVCMDKEITKQLLNAHGIRVVPWKLLRQSDVHDKLYAELSQQLGAKLIVKCNSLGSSVGVSLVDNSADFFAELKTAFKYDELVLVEQAITGREIECAVLGNAHPRAALPAEIILRPDYSFYSYQAKYEDPNAVQLKVPAELEVSQVAEIQRIAIEAFLHLRCRGLLRVDFFMTQSSEIYVNEVNTIPGFTDISMYPAMWQASGKTYRELLDDLIVLALQEWDVQQQLNRIKI